jgi:hypothetical protein
MATAYVLLLSLNPTNKCSLQAGTERTTQYVDGLTRFFALLNEHQQNFSNVFIVDNTISSTDMIPKDVLSVIPNTANILLTLQNKYGKINKGCGLIEQWIYMEDILNDYDWIIHFEPRLYLKSFHLIGEFLQKQRTIFTLGKSKNHFNTGLFCIARKDLHNYINQVDIVDMCNKGIPIEYSLFDYYNTRPYHVVASMDVIWHDTMRQQLRHM